jgi:hypothetical protein
MTELEQSRIQGAIDLTNSIYRTSREGFDEKEKRWKRVERILDQERILINLPLGQNLLSLVEASLSATLPLKGERPQTLTDLEKEVLKFRFRLADGLTHTVKATAAHIGLSPARVEQFQKSAFLRILGRSESPLKDFFVTYSHEVEAKPPKRRRQS